MSQIGSLPFKHSSGVRLWQALLFSTKLSILGFHCSKAASSEVWKGQQGLDDMQRLFVHLLARLQRMSQEYILRCQSKQLLCDSLTFLLGDSMVWILRAKSQWEADFSGDY